MFDVLATATITVDIQYMFWSFKSNWRTYKMSIIVKRNTSVKSHFCTVTSTNTVVLQHNSTAVLKKRVLFWCLKTHESFKKLFYNKFILFCYMQHYTHSSRTERHFTKLLEMIGHLPLQVNCPLHLQYINTQQSWLRRRDLPTFQINQTVSDTYTLYNQKKRRRKIYD